ncbi:MAG: CoA-binding protein [Gemmatimonadota bacterium]|nr:CoA-binding protein [Gemmatimonadota bacterium]MDE3012586.1 CoA-binding protein [Gemmatimonadota bacterium]
MDELAQLRHVLGTSSDADNPSAEAIVQLLDDVQRIAVVGLSRNLEKEARRVPSYLAAKGYDVIPVNPYAERLLGRVSYSDLASIPDTVDLVLIFRPSEEAGSFVEAAMARAEQPAIWLQTGIQSPAAVEVARRDGRVVVQDLCIFRVHRTLLD